MMKADDVARIYQILAGHQIQVWLTGGWGIDALLREQTRPHKDLDIIMLVDDVARMCDLLRGKGLTLKELWPEDRLTVDARGVQISTAFVLQDGEGREIDAHALRIDEHGRGIPAWENDEGLTFSKEGLDGEGWVAGLPVRCISPEVQVLCHTGYDLPQEQVRDMRRLRERFGLEHLSEDPDKQRPGA